MAAAGRSPPVLLALLLLFYRTVLCFGARVKVGHHSLRHHCHGDRSGLMQLLAEDTPEMLSHRFLVPITREEPNFSEGVCARGLSNQIECFARIFDTARMLNAVVVMENLYWWASPYAKNMVLSAVADKALSEFLMPTDTLFDVENFVVGMYCSTGIIIRRSLPEPLKGKDPGTVCLHSASFDTGLSAAAKKQLGKKQVIRNTCWRKAFFIGPKAAAIKQAVIQTLKFSQDVRKYSDAILHNITNSFQLPFMGLHLRMERDAVGVISRQLDAGALFKLLVKEHKLPQGTRLYIACSNFPGKDDVLKMFATHFEVLTKEQAIPNIGDIVPRREARSAVEFAVLMNSTVFFGHGCSSMSNMVIQMRCFQSSAKKAFAYDEHWTKGNVPFCKEHWWNGHEAFIMNEKQRVVASKKSFSPANRKLKT
eukprot:CAMPEP_0117694286 /NCGR_PEP_ID=MMETSP0804-20121206/27366_1 /TAXON_ID=1074897 /ORGANISM="Tetraselmis astigmatica, Strain CCMP880" /LENGTH=422 /DNA_ID=CAMNT_0005507963 /DNA_START=164 /DNA_END=1428 /DNA_ORIENTATION=+